MGKCKISSAEDDIVACSVWKHDVINKYVLVMSKEA